MAIIMTHNEAYFHFSCEMWYFYHCHSIDGHIHKALYRAAKVPIVLVRCCNLDILLVGAWPMSPDARHGTFKAHELLRYC